MSKLTRRNISKQNEVQGHMIDGSITLGCDRRDTKMLRNPKIFLRAKENAKKHKIKLVPGIENQGGGNCSYESVLLNINERDCFKEGFVMSPDYYRRVWNVDLMAKILDGRIEWNPGMTRSEIVKGFEELMQTGVYERDFFGDMMMAGIACGTRKRILIFNTHVMTPHDPISVIDPTHYGGIVDSDVPVVLAYDLVHYESLHTVDDDDIAETIKLVNSYVAQPSTYRQEYGFTREDMQYLITPSAAVKMSSENKKPAMVAPKKGKEYEESECFKFEGICFRELGNGNIICGICQLECMRLVAHMNESSRCSDIFSMDQFKSEFSKFRHTQSQNRKRKSEIHDGCKSLKREFRSNDPDVQNPHKSQKKEEKKEGKKARDVNLDANKKNVGKHPEKKIETSTTAIEVDSYAHKKK